MDLFLALQRMGMEMHDGRRYKAVVRNDNDAKKNKETIMRTTIDVGSKGITAGKAR